MNFVNSFYWLKIILRLTDVPVDDYGLVRFRSGWKSMFSIFSFCLFFHYLMKLSNSSKDLYCFFFKLKCKKVMKLFACHYSHFWGRAVPLTKIFLWGGYFFQDVSFKGSIDSSNSLKVRRFMGPAVVWQGFFCRCLLSSKLSFHNLLKPDHTLKLCCSF